ncbi:MAG: site-2 protease family protein [Candidatus Aenigmatarchaeota archaeon]|nr:site-2 protease family protein [Candidatus Aenigmarchaeota archaeon]
MVSFEITSILLFIIIVGSLLLKDRKNITFKYGIIIRRWTKGLELIDKLVRRYPKFVTWIGNIGIAVGLLAGLVGVAILIFLTVRLERAFGLILPTAGGYQVPGPVFSIPFWYWLLAIFIIATTHETMHAVFIRLEKVPVKNYGILMFLLLPIGAFVDPDNNRIKRLSLIKKLRIFAAGSFVNILTSFVAIGLLISSAFAFTIVTESVGVAIDSVAENSPADKANLEGTILQIDNKSITNVIDFVKALNNTKPGDEIEITTDKGEYRLILGEHPEIENRSYIGVMIRNSYEYNLFGFNGVVPLMFLRIFFTVMSFLNWLFLISMGIGIVNLLPIKPLDGGLFFGEIFTKLFKDKGNFLINLTSIVLIGLLLFNLFGIPWVKNFIG